jgi:hypothetical protein
MRMPRDMQRRLSVPADHELNRRPRATGRAPRLRFARRVIAVVLPTSVLAASFALLLAGHADSARSTRVATAAPRHASAAGRLPRRRLRAPERAIDSRVAEFAVTSPAQAATRFAVAWLACIYHQATCSRLPDALPGYARAITHRDDSALPTPAEMQAQLRVVSVHAIRTCPLASIARVVYANGTDGRFVLHLNLLRTGATWRVFDVAEAPPHIPLATELGHGPRGC